MKKQNKRSRMAAKYRAYFDRQIGIRLRNGEEITGYTFKDRIVCMSYKFPEELRLHKLWACGGLEKDYCTGKIIDPGATDEEEGKQ